MIALLSGDPLRTLVADLGRAMADQMTADQRASNAAAGRLTHIADEDDRRELMCGLERAHDTSVIANDLFTKIERPDICPDCAHAREVLREETHARHEAQRAANQAKREATGRRRGAKNVRKTDAVEAFVAAHPEGVTIAEVAAHVSQKDATADSTLRHVRGTRGTVERREGRWYPCEKEAPKPLYQPAIVRVLGEAREPIGAADVLVRVRKLRPEATLKGVAEEIHRMREMSPPMVEQRGENEHGLLYCLPAGGDSTSAVH